MASFGSFAGGLAQSMQGLPQMLQGKQTEELRQQQFAEQMRQQRLEEDSKFFTEGRARLGEVVAADPTQAPAFAEFLMGQWEEKNNVKAPSLFRKQLKEDPAGTLDALATAGPEKAREVMSDPRAFMNFFPSMLQAKSAMKAKEQAQVDESITAAGPAISEEFGKKFPGYTNAVTEAAVAETQLNMAVQNKASPAKVEALQKRVDSLKEKLDKGMPDDVKKAIIEFGGDPRSATIEEQQKALQNMRAIGVKQAGMEEEEKAFRKGRGENRAFLDPLGREAAQFRIDEEGFKSQAKKYGEIVAGLTPAGRQAVSLQLSTDLQKQAFEKDYTAAEKIEQQGPTLVKSKQVLANLKQALMETGPGGRITGEMKKKLTTIMGGLIPSEKVAAYDTIDQLVTEMGIQIAMQLRPITQKELQLSIDLPPNVRHTEEGRARMFNAMNLAVDKELELVGTASKWKGKVAQGQYDTPWSTEYSAWLNKWGEPPASNAAPGTKPGETSQAPVTPRTMTRLGIDSLPPAARTLSSAQAFVESNHDMDAVGKAGELSAWQIKPETAANPGLPGVRPLTKEELKDPVKTAKFSHDYLIALTREFNGNLRLGLAAYNAGVGNVRRYIDGEWNDPKVKGAYLAGLNYADKVLAAAAGKEQPEGDVESRKRSLIQKGGRVAAEVAGSVAGGGLIRGGLALAGKAGMRGAGAAALTGEALGTSAASLASNLFDPVADAQMEAATAGVLTLASGPFGSLIHKLVGPKGLTDNGRSLIRLATARGIADDVPAGSAIEGKLARNMAGIADDASFSGALQKKKEFLQNEFKLQGDMYAAEAIAMKATRDTFMEMADETLGAVKMNMKPIYKHIDDTLKAYESGTIRLEPDTIAAFNKLRGGGEKSQTLLQLDQLKQSLWKQWSKEVEQGNYGSATKASRQIGMLADYVDEVIDGALKNYPVERQYYKVGKAASLEVMQGNHMSWVLANSAKNSTEGIPDGKALLRLLNEGQKGPVKLTPAQRENMTELAKSFIALQDKPSTFRIVSRGLELGGLAAIVTGGATAIATGDPSALTSGAMLGGVAVALVPSTLAKIMASRPATKLLTRALIEKPGSEVQYRASSQLLTMMANEGWLVDDKPVAQQQGGQ